MLKSSNITDTTEDTTPILETTIKKQRRDEIVTMRPRIASGNQRKISSNKNKNGNGNRKKKNGNRNTNRNKNKNGNRNRNGNRNKNGNRKIVNRKKNKKNSNRS